MEHLHTVLPRKHGKELLLHLFLETLGQGRANLTAVLISSLELLQTDWSLMARVACRPALPTANWGSMPPPP